MARSGWVPAVTALSAVLALLCPAAALAAPSIELHVDATDAPRGFLRMHETIPVAAGPLMLVYPKWIPGTHGPTGEIQNLAGLVIRAGDRTLPWSRDPVALYAFHVDVPEGVTSLEVDFEYLAASTSRLSAPNLMSLEWNEVVLTPFAEDQRRTIVTPALRLPSPDWKYATALETTGTANGEVTFAPVSLETLVDSPLDAGTNERIVDLGAWGDGHVRLAMFADTAEQLAASDKTLAKFRNLVTQMRALYVNRHWRDYTFLLTLSDQIPGEGLEHHASSDNGVTGDYLTADAALTSGADLLAHEFNHSWDGKFRRPADLATPNLQAPMIDDLLWVYEGMTQFYGNLQAERAGLRTEQQWLDGLALNDAAYASERGRLTRPLVDTATSSSFLYGARGPWATERRSVDYYSEAELMWLEADVRIRALTGGKRSLDDFARTFFGHGADTGPEVLTYTREDLIAGLNAVAAYDWRAFFAARVDAIAPHPPDFLTLGGYALSFADHPSGFEKISNERRKTIDLRYSLGIVGKTDGTIVDVLPDSIAFRAGIGPGAKIVAVNDRALTLTDVQKQIDDALRAARTGPALRLLIETGSVFRDVTLDDRDGPRYPYLTRVAERPDVLGAIAKPLPAP